MSDNPWNFNDEASPYSRAKSGQTPVARASAQPGAQGRRRVLPPDIYLTPPEFEVFDAWEARASDDVLTLAAWSGIYQVNLAQLQEMQRQGKGLMRRLAHDAATITSAVQRNLGGA